LASAVHRLAFFGPRRLDLGAGGERLGAEHLDVVVKLLLDRGPVSKPLVMGWLLSV
jgi:hypothetical protein